MSILLSVQPGRFDRRVAHAAPAVIAAILRLSRRSRGARSRPPSSASPSTSPTMRPSRMTRMRWQMPISSCISEEMTMTALPRPASSAMNLIDLLLGADVDAARRFVDDDDLRIELHHLGKQQLLLVAAGKLAGKHVVARRADIELADGGLERGLLFGTVEHGPAGELPKRGQRQVGGEIAGEQQAFALAILAQINDADLAGCRARNGTRSARLSAGLRRDAAAGRRRLPSARCALRRSGRQSQGSRPAGPRTRRRWQSPERRRMSPRGSARRAGAGGRAG